MKGFYAFAAAVAVGSLMSASAFVQKQFAPQPSVETHVLHQGKPVQIAPADARIPGKKAQKAVSRAEEEGYDFTKFQCQTYLDFFCNSYQDGNYLYLNPEDEWIWSSANVEIVEEDGHWYMKGLFGEEIFNPEITVSETGISIELGQMLYTSDSYSYYLYLVSGDDEGNILMEGSLDFNLYTNALEIESELGVYAVKKSTGQGAGYYSLGFFNIWWEPNATLTYTQTYEDEYGNVVATNEISNRVYCEYDPEAYEEETEYGTVIADVLTISNVTPFNAGFMVDFLVLDDYAAAMNAVAFPSQYTNSGTETGDYYVCAYFEEDGTFYYTNEIVEGKLAEDYTTFEFPYSFPDGAITNYTGWSLIAMDSGYYMGDLTAATLTFDYPINEERPDSGINSVIADNNSNAPAEYYNLQGVKVANPEAGQVYILKQGTKAVKTIIR